MKIEKNVNDNTMTLALEGWLDTQAAPELGTIIDGITDEIQAVVFDFKGLEYISSSGIRQIVAAYKKVNGNCTLKNVSAEIMDILSMTGIAKKVRIE